jgi:hypothetical protein
MAPAPLSIWHTYTTGYTNMHILVFHGRRHACFFVGWPSPGETSVAAPRTAAAQPPLPASTMLRGQTHVPRITLYPTHAYDRIYKHAYACVSWVTMRVLLDPLAEPGRDFRRRAPGGNGAAGSTREHNTPRANPCARVTLYLPQVYDRLYNHAYTCVS